MSRASVGVQAGSIWWELKDAATSVGGSSTPVLPADTDRFYLCLVNDSDYVVYVSFGQPAALHQGIRLNAGGGRFEMAVAAGQANLVWQAVNAISASDGPALLTTEAI